MKAINFLKLAVLTVLSMFLISSVNLYVYADPTDHEALGRAMKGLEKKLGKKDATKEKEDDDDDEGGSGGGRNVLNLLTGGERREGPNIVDHFRMVPFNCAVADMTTEILAINEICTAYDDAIVLIPNVLAAIDHRPEDYEPRMPGARVPGGIMGGEIFSPDPTIPKPPQRPGEKEPAVDPAPGSGHSKPGAELEKPGQTPIPPVKEPGEEEGVIEPGNDEPPVGAPTPGPEQPKWRPGLIGGPAGGGWEGLGGEGEEFPGGRKPGSLAPGTIYMMPWLPTIEIDPEEASKAGFWTGVGAALLIGGKTVLNYLDKAAGRVIFMVMPPNIEGMQYDMYYQDSRFESASHPRASLDPSKLKETEKEGCKIMDVRGEDVEICCGEIEQGLWACETVNL